MRPFAGELLAEDLLGVVEECRVEPRIQDRVDACPEFELGLAELDEVLAVFTAEDGPEAPQALACWPSGGRRPSIPGSWAGRGTH